MVDQRIIKLNPVSLKIKKLLNFPLPPIHQSKVRKGITVICNSTKYPSLTHGKEYLVLGVKRYNFANEPMLKYLSGVSVKIKDDTGAVRFIGHNFFNIED